MDVSQWVVTGRHHRGRGKGAQGPGRMVAAHRGVTAYMEGVSEGCNRATAAFHVEVEKP